MVRKMLDLYPHQVEAVDWLTSHDRCGLFDEQGLGKTISVLSAIEQLGLTKVLVIAPTAVVYNWQREAWKWTTKSAQVIATGRGRPALGNHQIVITTHGLLLNRGLLESLMAEEWDAVVVDESHCFRNRKAKRTTALYGGVIQSAARVWLLTGTPMPNNPSELWTMLRALAPERIKIDQPESAAHGRPMSFLDFRSRYCRLAPSAYGDGWKVVGAQNSPELRQRLHGFALRRTADQELDLPPLRFGTVTLEPPAKLPAELAVIENQLKAAREMGLVDDDESVLDWLRDNSEFASYRRLCALAKAEAAADLIAADLEAGGKAVVFAHHTDVIDTIEARLKKAKIGSVKITGATPPAAREAFVNAFQNGPGARVALCNIVAGGVGITLTAAQRVYFVEQSFVPGDNAQAVKRCHRIGQTGSVLVQFMALANSVDEIVADVLATKTAMIDEVMS